MNPAPLIPQNLPRILVIGVGSIGERHVRCFQQTGQCVVSVCEPNDSLRSEIAARYDCEAFVGIDAAVASATFDAAVVSTPAQTHVPLARKCIEAGLHVLIEKPLSVSMDGIDDLAAEAARADRQVRVAYIYRFLSAIQRARELLLEGCCGAVRHVVVTSGQHFPTFRPAYRSIYYAKRESGGGAIQDALTHQIHAVEWLVSPMERVLCHAAHQVLPDVDVEDTVNLSASMKCGAMASMTLNQFQAINEILMTFHGTEGSLRVELPASRVGRVKYGDSSWEWENLPPQDRDAPFIAQALDFLAATRGCASVGSTLAEAKQTLRVNLAALRASEEKQEVSV